MSSVELTEQVLIDAATPAMVEASQKAMRTCGHVIVAKNGWIMKINQDGSNRKISKIKSVKVRNIKLD